MYADALRFDLYALAKPKSRADLLALVDEARAEFARINAHLDRMFSACEAESPADA